MGGSTVKRDWVQLGQKFGNLDSLNLGDWRRDRTEILHLMGETEYNCMVVEGLEEPEPEQHAEYSQREHKDSFADVFEVLVQAVDTKSEADTIVENEDVEEHFETKIDWEETCIEVLDEKHEFDKDELD